MKHGVGAETISVFELLTEHFATEQSAIDFVEDVRWNGKHDCPNCESTNIVRWNTRAGHWRCRDCRKIHSVRVGTIFEDSKIPLRKWLYAIYKQQTARKGVSSLQLSKELGVTKKTAWFVQQRLRDAAGSEMEAIRMIMNDVEVDEVYIGGLERNKHESKRLNVGGGTRGKQAVFGLRERETGQVIMFPISDATKKTLQSEIQNHVAEGVTVYSDDAKGYKGLEALGYNHETVTHSQKATVGRFVDGAAHTNGIESVWALLRRGFTGTFHHWTPKHTMLYLNEFAFRLNEGNVKIDTIDRMRSLVERAIGKRLTYHVLISKEAT